MICYADTAFLMKLFLPEPDSDIAITAARESRAPLVISHLSRLEMKNALELNVFQKKISPAVASAAWQAFEEDLEGGTLELRALASAELHEQAIQLSGKYSAKLGARSLDLLHVAAALILGARAILTFDHRQRRVAELEGLRVKPRI